MNVHTVEISCLLGPKLINKLCKRQEWFYFKGRGNRNHGWASMIDFVNGSTQDIGHRSACLESDMYPANGIQKVSLVRNPSKWGYFYFVVIVNLESLYRQSMTVESFQFTEERIQRCSNEFRKVMSNFTDVPFIPLIDWSTRRIDYAVDVRHPGLASLYVILAQQGRIPRGMEQRQLYTGSYYLESPNDDVTINFYDKEDQIRKDRYLHHNDRLLQEANGLLRFEVQCQGRKLKHIREMVKRRDLPHSGMKLRTFLNREVANDVVQHYYSKVIGYLDYYNLQLAEHRLHEQPGRQDMKERILLFLHQVNQVGSVTAAIQAYYEGIMPDMSPALISGPKSSLQNLLNSYLPRFGLNPVTIPDIYQLDYLPNPMPVDLRSNR